MRSSIARLAAIAALGAISPLQSLGGVLSPREELPSRAVIRSSNRRSQRRDRDMNGVLIGLPGSKLARKAAKGSVGLYGGRRGMIAHTR
jgi:hypothetical protein